MNERFADFHSQAHLVLFVKYFLCVSLHKYKEKIYVCVFYVISFQVKGCILKKKCFAAIKALRLCKFVHMYNIEQGRKIFAHFHFKYT